MTSQYNINQNLSLVIPSILPQRTNEQYIIDVFHKQNIGKVYKVDIIRKKDEPGRCYPIYQAFIYFSAWYENDIAYHFQQRLYSEKKQTRIVYDDPCYWIIFENKKRFPSEDDLRIMRLGYELYITHKYIFEQSQNIQRLQEELYTMKQTINSTNSLTEQNKNIIKCYHYDPWTDKFI
jgi:hypothetical protein